MDNKLQLNLAGEGVVSVFPSGIILFQGNDLNRDAFEERFDNIKQEVLILRGMENMQLWAFTPSTRMKCFVFLSTPETTDSEKSCFLCVFSLVSGKKKKWKQVYLDYVKATARMAVLYSLSRW